ncbi:phosphate signaling complex protein PhoU [Arsenicicoccus piscis]|uniref:Phosphate-specific transport system accessory protein PhoU n=1 Tax=Arsenicicoccus piscis TaxID=673954 RepID=A0ABQ6HTC1_9MICO|nr:phosphate signaling complex protein PhoU [Arsenicicoccus piscis]MCH8627900.1 phosphate signaling complex protein PhoU [Arsenicicoccus piscis]GMA20779.1 phosphate transport system regulatory protein PhoU [Arsenicicoccus piscis]
MRDAFHEALDQISDQLVEMTRLAGSAMSRATTALLDADLQLAESVIAADENIDDLRRQLDNMAIDLLARQQPVATDLRMVVTAMRMSADLERMGDLARHIAKVARLRYPDSAIPPVLRPTIVDMGHEAERIVIQTGAVIHSKDVHEAQALEQADDAMDALHRKIFNTLLSGSWDQGVQAAVDVTLVGRYYERFADHAVSVARRVVYLVTGEWADEDAEIPGIDVGDDDNDES